MYSILFYFPQCTRNSLTLRRSIAIAATSSTAFIPTATTISRAASRDGRPASTRGAGGGGGGRLLLPGCHQRWELPPTVPPGPLRAWLVQPAPQRRGPPCITDCCTEADGSRLPLLLSRQTRAVGVIATTKLALGGAVNIRPNLEKLKWQKDYVYESWLCKKWCFTSIFYMLKIKAELYTMSFQRTNAYVDTFISGISHQLIDKKYWKRVLMWAHGNKR